MSRGGKQTAVILGAIGVVFGDIGTSPLYSLHTVFTADNGAVKATEGDVFGIISLVFWAITLIVTIEFVGFIMRADNDGEGGIMALIGLVERARLRDSRWKVLLVALGLMGVALFYGDGMITPAISVLSAVEGLEVVEPSLESMIVPITVGLLIGVFAIQRFGTSSIGRVFGPVMVVWFGALAAAGLGRILGDPSVLKALSPTYGIEFFADHPAIAFISLGSVVLTITGAEALYADMGHFGRRPISRAWILVVFPALTLNYLGQGSLIVEHPTAISSPFFLLIPDWSRMPMVILATVATIIASQAVISGAFSVTRQAIHLGFLPRIAIRHTSQSEFGQVYAPLINWGLLAAVLILVIAFGSSANLAAAYGVAVTVTITVDTILFLVVARKLWKSPSWLVAIGAAVFLTVDIAFLAANANKLFHGGWFPVAIGLLIFMVLSTWKKGNEVLEQSRIEREGTLLDFIEEVRPLAPPSDRPEGATVYLNPRIEATPLALREDLEAGVPLASSVIVLSLVTKPVPHVPDEHRLEIDDLGDVDDGIAHVTARLGFQDIPAVPPLIELLHAERPDLLPKTEQTRYVLTRIEIETEPGGGMARWRKRLFATLARRSANPIGYFKLPEARTSTTSCAIRL